MKIKGEVFQKRYAPGSKSDHNAVMIRTADGEFKLRREGGNPFRDPTLDALVGKRIQAEARQTETVVIMADWTEDNT